VGLKVGTRDEEDFVVVILRAGFARRISKGMGRQGLDWGPSLILIGWAQDDNAKQQRSEASSVRLLLKLETEDWWLANDLNGKTYCCCHLEGGFFPKDLNGVGCNFRRWGPSLMLIGWAQDDNGKQLRSAESSVRLLLKRELKTDDNAKQRRSESSVADCFSNWELKTDLNGVKRG